MDDLITTIIRAGADLLDNRDSDDLTAIGPTEFTQHQNRGANNLPWVDFDDPSCFDRLVGNADALKFYHDDDIPADNVVSVRRVYDSLVEVVGTLSSSICYECGVDGLKKSTITSIALDGRGIFEVENEMLYPNDTLLVQYNVWGFSGVRCVIKRGANCG